MSAPSNPGSNVYSQGFGSTPISSLGCVPVVQPRSPSPSDVRGAYGTYALGQMWINNVATQSFQLLSFTSIGGTIRATWALVSNAAGELASLTTQDSTVVVPTAGTIFVNGAATQFTTTGAGSTVTLSYTNPSILPGAIVVGGGAAFASTLATFNTQAQSTTLITHGTKTTVSAGSDQFGITDNTIFSPTASNTLSVSMAADPSFIAAAAQTMGTAAGVSIGVDTANNIGTITNAYGLFVSASPATGGTVNNFFGAFISDPGTGTNHMALYADNMNIGTSGIVPPPSGLYVTGQLQLNSSLDLLGAASKILINAGTPATASIGTSAAMVGGTVTVSTTAVTASSFIFLSYHTPGGTLGSLSQGTIVPGVSFVINSSSGADTSTVNYWIID